MPQAEEQLRACLGSAYVDEEWQPAYRIVMEAENDSGLVLEGLPLLMRIVMSPLIYQRLILYQPRT